MKLTQVLTEEVIHPDVKGLVIDKKEVCPNGKIREIWKGNFEIYGHRAEVSSLEGCPRVVEDWFHVISQKYLTTLKGSPEKAGYVSVWRCSALKDLTGITPVSGSYRIGGNDSLLSLNGIPLIGDHDLHLESNPKLSFTACQFPSIKSLAWVDNKDVSLHDFHRHFPKISKYLRFSEHIQSHVLSVLLIEGLQEIYSLDDLKPMVAIINQHLPNTLGKKGMLRCQAELIDAGYEEYAQL